MREPWTHPSADDLGDYVMDLMAPDEALCLEEHVAGCPPCAARLRREAERDAMLRTVAERGLPGRPRRPRLASALAGTVAAAAAALTVLTMPASSPSAREGVMCQQPDDGGAVLACEGPTSPACVMPDDEGLSCLADTGAGGPEGEALCTAPGDG